ncbi:MAG: glutathione S-transferase C-terminal domain-containing protein [Burkholderiales bacterium]|nr:MAG: glutathione S-transferase C-terminal domain-containing protein [Burkholderiales bacterium]
MYRLHCFSQSGNSYKVAFLLRALGQPFEPVFVDFMHGATRDPNWRAHTNEMGEAPVLDTGTRRITQSGAILTYLADTHGAYGGRTPDERLEILRWLLFDNHKFTSYFATYRFSKAFGPVAPDPAVMNWLKGRIDNAWGIVDKHLASSPYIVGGEPTIADFSLSGYVFYPPEESGYDIPAQFPHLGAWMGRMKAIPGWGPPYDILPGERIAPKW